MIYKAQKGRVGYGQAIGILMLEDPEPFYPPGMWPMPAPTPIR